MARNRDLRAPATYAKQGEWPEGSLLEPSLAEYARQFTLNLRAAIGSRSLRDVAASAGLSHVTLVGIIRGDRWPDTLTLAKLEEALDVELWPRRTVELRAGLPHVGT